MTDALISVLKLFIVVVVLIAVGYFFGMVFAIIPGINTLLTNVPFLTPEMIPTLMAWIMPIGVVGAGTFGAMLKVVKGGGE